MVDPATSDAPFPSTIGFIPSETCGFYQLGDLDIGVALDCWDANPGQLGLSTTTHQESND